MRLASSPAVPRRSPSCRSLPRLSPRPAAARLRPVAANHLISVRFPITAPPPPPFVPRHLPRPAAARLRPVASHYLISVRFPITVPPPAAPNACTHNAVRRSDPSHAFRGPFRPLRHAQALPRRPTVAPSLARKISLPSCGGRGDCCMMNMVQFAPKHGTGA